MRTYELIVKHVHITRFMIDVNNNIDGFAEVSGIHSALIIDGAGTPPLFSFITISVTDKTALNRLKLTNDTRLHWLQKEHAYCEFIRQKYIFRTIVSDA